MFSRLRRSRRYLRLDGPLRVVAGLVVPDTQTHTHTHTHRPSTVTLAHTYYRHVHRFMVRVPGLVSQSVPGLHLQFLHRRFPMVPVSDDFGGANKNVLTKTEATSVTSLKTLPPLTSRRSRVLWFCRTLRSIGTQQVKVDAAVSPLMLCFSRYRPKKLTGSICNVNYRLECCPHVHFRFAAKSP